MSKFNKHIIIVGTARSGTSWLSETIAQQHRYRMLFEPDQEQRTKKGYLICDQWIENEDESLDAVRYLNQIFLNRVDCNWIAQNSNRKFKMHLWPFIPKKFVIKFVRANLSAKFINDYFGIPVIHLIRNPYEVIESQLKVRFPWLINLKCFASQPKLVTLISSNFELDITKYDHFTEVEKLAIRWCIENVIPLEILSPYISNSKVIRYEDLISDIQVFYDLCHKFDLDYVDSIENIYRHPSSKTHSSSPIATKKIAKSTLKSEDLDQIEGILNIFKTRLYPRTYVGSNQ